MNRRQLLVGATGIMLGSQIKSAAAREGETVLGVKWEIGCFNRPWSRWSFDEALDGMKAAGFRQIGLLGDHKGEALIYPEATPDYLDRLKRRIEARRLKVIFGRMRTRHDVPLQDAIADVHKQVDNAARLHLHYLMALGTNKPEEYDHFYQVMRDAAAYAALHHLQIVFKPHGGCTATAEEMLTCIKKVDHSNFQLWYDAGNIIYYTGKDPVSEVVRVARQVKGFCAKECARPGGDVMLQFGEGKVDFGGVFHELKSAGFQGPVMIEGCGGQTPAEVTDKARENRLFLERLFESL